MGVFRWGRQRRAADLTEVMTANEVPEKAGSGDEEAGTDWTT